MKNLLILLIAITLYSCKEDIKPTYVLINGNIENNNAKAALIFGDDFEKKLAISESGSFNDTLKIAKNGFYTLRIGRESTLIYLSQGASVGLSLNANEFDESISYTGDVAAENNYLAAKYLLSEKEMAFDKVYSLPEYEFITEIENINSSYKGLLKNTQGLSDKFIESEVKELKYAHINNLENYQEYHKFFTKKSTFSVSDNYYDGLKDFDYKNMEAYNSSKTYKALLETHFNRLASQKEGNSSLVYLTIVDENVPDGHEKDELMTNYLRYGMKADSSLDQVYALYKETNPASKNLPKITKHYELLKNLVPGKASPTFAYENHKGGETSLADLKGKIVYIDVWATWCGPCKREIPFLKELEAEYHDENVAFVSISIDEKKDYDAWKKMVTDKELGGIQLMADNDWSSTFVTDYSIKGIPRFLLIDTEGNIINSDAPRPSSPEIEEVLDELLETK